MTARAGTAAHSSYRPEIDGLRAIAVVAVIFFHAGFEAFGGGFLGVDVFFVISGFLITGLILQEQASGSFSLAVFYARRARRILPALFFVMVVCTVPAAMLMTAAQRADLFRTMGATALFGSNFFLASTTGYFDSAAELRPLLHTWSLAVEEQFYFLFPLLLIVSRPLGPKRLGWLLLALAAASLILSEYGWRHDASLNFYLTPSRAWELLVGALGALLCHSRRGKAGWPSGTFREALGAMGLLAVLGSFVLFNRYTPAPSVYCLVPTLGTVLMLMYAERDTITGRLLSWRVLTGIGLVSYSAYLWHQPLFAFARIRSLEAPSDLLMVGLIVATFVLAAMSWRWVEQPVRRLGGYPVAKTLRAGLAGSAAIALASVVGVLVWNQAPATVPVTVLSAFKSIDRAKECFDVANGHAVATGWYCEINPGGEPSPSFVLYGDSHSLQLLEAFTLAAREAGRSGIFAGFSGCPPLPGTVPLTRPDQGTRDCRALNDRMYEWTRSHRIKDMFLVAKWSYYTDVWAAGYTNAIGLKPGDPVTLQASRASFAAGAANSVAWARNAGTRLHVIAQVPQQPYPPATVYERTFTSGRAPEPQLREFSVTSARHEAMQAYPNAVWRELADATSLTFVSFDKLLCDGERCPIGTATQSYYQDQSHLSADGAARLVPAIQRLLAGSPN